MPRGLNGQRPVTDPNGIVRKVRGNDRVAGELSAFLTGIQLIGVPIWMPAYAPLEITERTHYAFF